MNLFEVPIIEKEAPTTKCRHCVFSERHQCNSKVFWYCGIRKSNRTDNGKLKIKAGDVSCILFQLCAI